MNAAVKMLATEFEIHRDLEMARGSFHMSMGALNDAMSRYAATANPDALTEAYRHWDAVREARRAEHEALVEDDRLRFAQAIAQAQAAHREAE